MPRRYYHAVPLQNRTSVWNDHLMNIPNTWQHHSSLGKDFDLDEVKRSLASLGQTSALRLEQIAYSVQNCTQLLHHIDSTRAPLLRDLDLSFRGYYPANSFDNTNGQTAADQHKLDDWSAWFTTNVAPEQPSISNTRNLNISGHVYAISDTKWCIFDIMLALLSRMPRLRTIDLAISGLTSTPRSELDFQTSLPRFEEMEELTIGRSSLKFVHALLSKMGAKFKTLNIVGNLVPGVREGPSTIEGLEDPGDRASVDSASRRTSTSMYMRPVDLLEVLRDLSSISTTSSGDGEPLRLNRLAIAPLAEPRRKKESMRVAQAASVLITMPLFSRLHVLILDRPVFSCLCAYASVYLAGNPLPATVRNLGVVLTHYTLRETDPHVYGEGCTRVEQAFGYLGRQIERGEARKLRRVKVMLHDTGYNESSDVWETDETGIWKEFKATCRRWRIGVHVDDTGSEQ